MTIPAIGSIPPGFTPFTPPAAPTPDVSGAGGVGAAAAGTGAASAGSSTSFGAALANGLDKLQSVQNTSDKLAAQAATGDLRDAHDYLIASTEASLQTELTVAVRNKAVDAFNEIMRMPV